MREVQTTDVFSEWFKSLRDPKARARIQARIDRLELGHFGDVAPVGDGISELRIFHGPGYRVYLMERSSAVVILLCGGDKDTQKSDIAKAKRLAQQIEI